MNSAILLTKLIEIEQAIGVEELSKVRNMVIEAQECLLVMQRESLDRLLTRSKPAVIERCA